jgi:flagellar biosynthesis GTPase FlhF
MSTPGELLEALGRQARARLGNGGAVRTYRGRSVEELIPVIERELGAEAIVVRRREGLSGGVLGFFQHAYVEIEAMPGQPAVDVYDEHRNAEPAAPVALPVQPADATDTSRSTPPLPAVEPAAAPPPPFQPSAPPAQPSAPFQPPARFQPSAPPLLRTPAYAPAPAPDTPASTEQTASSEQTASAGQTASTEHVFRPGGTPALDAAPESSGAAGSAYVTAHLAALARASRSRGQARDGDRVEGVVGPLARAADRSAPSYGGAVRPARDPDRARQPDPAGDVVGGARELSYRRARSERRPTPAAPPPWSNDFQEIAAEELSELIPRPVDPIQAPTSAAAGERRVVAPGSHGRARAGVAKSLERYGISEALAHELIDGASAHALALAPRAGMAQAVHSTLAQRIPVAPPLPTQGAAVVVVGAGGAGKTTCCAALLGAYRKSSSLPASFATLARHGDAVGRRGGAANAAGEGLRLILSPHVMKPTPARTPRALRALRRARSEGMAVLDTPRLSPADRAGIRELAGLLAELKPERVVVALPATLGAAAAAQLLEALRPLGANSLAITHADETDQIGVAVEAACAFGLAPEYVLDRGRGGGWRLSRVDPAGLAARLLP